MAAVSVKKVYCQVDCCIFKLMDVRGHPARMEPIARLLRMGTAVSLAPLDGREKIVMKV